MKTKILLLIVAVCFMNISCDEVETTTNDNKEIELTAKNYLYEGTIYKGYLSDLIVTTQEEIEVLQKIIKNQQSDGQTQEDLAQAQENIEEYYKKLNGIINITAGSRGEGDFGIIPPPPPPPPCPQLIGSDGNPVINFTCITIDDSQTYIVTTNETTELVVSFYTTNNELIGKSNSNLISLQEYDNEIKVQLINLPYYEGEVLLKIEKTDNQRNTIIYETRAYIN